MTKIILVVKILLIVAVLGGILYAATMFSPNVRYQAAKLLHLPGVSVQGAMTKSQLPDALKKDMAQQADQVKKNALNIKISDILGFFGRAKKIVDDAKGVGSTATTQAEKLLPHK